MKIMSGRRRMGSGVWARAGWMGGCAVAVGWMPGVLAQVLVERVRIFPVGETLGDVENPPRTFTGIVSGTGIEVLTQVKVGLHLAGAPDGFASEMVVMVTKDLTRTSVLLNRVGLGLGGEPGSLVGYGYNGWNVTFVDGAARGDVHAWEVGTALLTGEIEPDGRAQALDAARPWTLGVMNGMTGDGSWILSVADMAAGGEMRLEGWSLTLEGWTAVPEPAEVGGWTATGLACWWGWRRRRARAGGRDGANATAASCRWT